MRIVEIAVPHYQAAPDKLQRVKGDLIVVSDEEAARLVKDGTAKWYTARPERKKEDGMDQHE